MGQAARGGPVASSPFGITFRHQSNAEFMRFTRFISPYCVTDLAIFKNAAEHSCLAPKFDLLMYRTFAVQSGESARQQRLALALPYVLLWSNRAVIHLENEDSRNDPRPLWVVGRTRRIEPNRGATGIGYRLSKMRFHCRHCIAAPRTNGGCNVYIRKTCWTLADI